MHLRVELPTKTDETVGVKVSGIVVRPVHDRQLPRIVHQLAAYFDIVAGTNRTTWCDADVIDDLQASRGASHIEGFMYGVRTRSIKKPGRRRYGCKKVYPCRRFAGIRSGEVHAGLFTQSLGRDKSEAGWELSLR